jgi:hypothetical protein
MHKSRLPKQERTKQHLIALGVDNNGDNLIASLAYKRYAIVTIEGKSYEFCKDKAAI